MASQLFVCRPKLVYLHSARKDIRQLVFSVEDREREINAIDLNQ